MGKKLFVGNLGHDVTDGMLAEWFGEYGPRPPTSASFVPRAVLAPPFTRPLSRKQQLLKRFGIVFGLGSGEKLPRRRWSSSDHSGCLAIIAAAPVAFRKKDPLLFSRAASCQSQSVH
jgi:hypothetical protein